MVPWKVAGPMKNLFWSVLLAVLVSLSPALAYSPQVGTVVATLPAGCQPVFIDGLAYYTVNGVTYVQTTSGYQVVPPLPMVANNIATQTSPPPAYVPGPAATSAPPPALFVPVQKPVVDKPVATVPDSAGVAASKADDAFTINIPSAKGGYVPVTLKKSGTGFIGPQGEYYPEFPKVELLKVMYGK